MVCVLSAVGTRVRQRRSIPCNEHQAKDLKSAHCVSSPFVEGFALGQGAVSMSNAAHISSMALFPREHKADGRPDRLAGILRR